ncbi:hypothetical protein BH24CHL5_BH24CHL5_05360 [soil metagenome]
MSYGGASPLAPTNSTPFREATRFSFSCGGAANTPGLPMLYGVESAVPFVVLAGIVALTYLRVRMRWPAARLFFLGRLQPW